MRPILSICIILPFHSEISLSILDTVMQDMLAMENCDNCSWKRIHEAKAYCEKEYGTLQMGLDETQPHFCWIKCEKTYGLQLQTNKIFTSHSAMGENDINDVEKDQPVISAEK